jgi:hypothetical protein
MSKLIPHSHHLLLGLTALAVLLVLASLGGLVAKFYFGDPWFHGLVPMFDLDVERNIPSFFSTGLILLCAGMMAALAYREPRSNRPGWQGLSLIFVVLSADELVSLHERLIEPVRATLHTSGVLYFAWVVPYGVAAILIGLLYLRFLFRLPRLTRNRMIVAGCVYVGGAVGLELVGGAYLEILHDQHNLPYELLTTVEESLEMAGMILLLRALLKHFGGETEVIRSVKALSVATTRFSHGRNSGWSEGLG